MIESGRHWLGSTVLVSVLGLVGCNAPHPVMPDGSRRVPVNSDARIEAFKTKAAEARRSATEDVRWTREVQSLKAEVAQLRAATIVLAADAEGKSQSPLAKAAAARLASGQPSVTAALHGVPSSSPVIAEARSEPPPRTAPAIEPTRPVTMTLQPEASDATGGAPLRLIPAKASAGVSPVTPSVGVEAARTIGTPTGPARVGGEPSVIAAPPESRSPEPPVPAVPAVDAVPALKTPQQKEPTTALADARTTAGQGPGQMAGVSPPAPTPAPMTLQPAIRPSPIPTAFKTEDLEPRRRAILPPTTAQTATPEKATVAIDADRQFRIAPTSIGFGFVPPHESAPALVQAARSADRVVIRSRAGGQAEAERARQYLIGHGVPADRIWIATGSLTEQTSELVITVSGSLPGTAANDAPTIAARN
jgi:hypothetical protein